MTVRLLRLAALALGLCASSALAQPAPGTPALPPASPGTPAPDAPLAPPPPVAADAQEADDVDPSVSVGTGLDAAVQADKTETARKQPVGQSWSLGGAVLHEDVEPSVTALHAEGLDVKLGALTQVQFAPYVGDEALIANGDPASEAGFRVRRARLGIEASFDWNLGAFLNLDLLNANATDGIVSDAKLTWSPLEEARFAVGSGKVPYSRGALQSSRHLTEIERPIAIGAITPGRRLGFTVEGTVLWQRLSYLLGVMNGTDGFGVGNQFGGILYGARLEVTPFGTFDTRDPWANGVSVGGGALYDNGPGTNTVAWSADIYGALFGAFATFEAMCNNTKPDEEPVVAPGVADSVKRCGFYGELGYTLPWTPLEMRFQPVLRAELFDDDTSLDNAGDVLVLTGGINAQIIDPYVRAQLNYIARREQHGEERQNDIVLLALQGTF